MYPQRPPQFPSIPGVPQNQMQGGTQIAQQYTPGGTQTNTMGGSYGVAQTPDLSQYFNAMLVRYKRAMEAQQRQAAMPQMQAPQRQYRPESSVTPNDRRVQDMEQEAKIAQLQAMISPPPVKMQGQGIQQIPGWGMADPHTMSGAQRQAYLPNDSRKIPSQEDTATAKTGQTTQERYDATFAPWMKRNENSQVITNG